MPFLASRRMVVVTSPQARLNNPASQDKFKALLDQLPATAALVLVEYRSLPENDWLMSWARGAGTRAFVRHYPLLKEGDLAQWLQGQARQSGGQMTPAAAWLLARMVGPDTRLAYQELQKLLAYVNYSRSVEAEDVETLSIPVFHEKIFALVDALAEQNSKKAPGLLRRFLEEEDPQYVLSMIVRQFRLLLMAREVLDEGGNEREVYSRLKLKHPRQAESISAQARRFSIETLEGVLRSLLEIDEAIKSGRIEVEVALESMAASFTA
jgi:DNA polymerase-3 subunit delta